MNHPAPGELLDLAKDQQPGTKANRSCLIWTLARLPVVECSRNMGNEESQGFWVSVVTHAAMQVSAGHSVLPSFSQQMLTQCQPRKGGMQGIKVAWPGAALGMSQGGRWKCNQPLVVKVEPKLLSLTAKQI